MRLSGFPNLSLGSIEVVLTNSNALLERQLAVCSCCNYCCPEMHVADCGHVFCDRCVAELNRTEGTVISTATLCTLCMRPVKTSTVLVAEPFVADLDCSCPTCAAVLKVSNVRHHLAQCLLDDSGNVEGVPTDISAMRALTATFKQQADTAARQISDVVACLQLREAYDTLENRLNAIEERMMHLNQTILPVRHMLRFLSGHTYTGGRVYRTQIVYCGGFGFIFYGKTNRKHLYFIVLSCFDSMADRVTPPWKITVKSRSAASEAGSSIIVRQQHVGQHDEISDFFRDHERHGAVLNVDIERAVADSVDDNGYPTS